ncbi:MAG: aspartate carbamoyltransferase catalytic subunit [Halobacteriovoraceae bacterium]|nr:aspartate carbamoyltransferase catalytic subunit [Halobacteriovoraceae bacterium]
MAIKNLLSIKDLSKDLILEILERAIYFENHFLDSQNFFSDHIVANLFFEPSTRTALSFELAAKNLGIRTLSLQTSSSSVQKGESLLDTLLTIQSMGVNASVVRLKEENILREVSAELSMKLINAGEGTIEHPTQALLDALTIYKEFGTLEGKNITIIGDINHSRVASSVIDLFALFDMTVGLFIPEEFGSLNRPWKNVKLLPLDDAIKDSDVLICLRNQLERHEKTYISPEEFHKKYGINAERLKAFADTSIIMHPGPYNREVEISSEALLDSRCRIQQQVQNGVYTRMAVIEGVLNG